MVTLTLAATTDNWRDKLQLRGVTGVDPQRGEERASHLSVWVPTG